jgi:hypothetical protein
MVRRIASRCLPDASNIFIRDDRYTPADISASSRRARESLRNGPRAWPRRNGHCLSRPGCPPQSPGRTESSSRGNSRIARRRAIPSRDPGMAPQGVVVTRHRFRFSEEFGSQSADCRRDVARLPPVRVTNEHQHGAQDRRDCENRNHHSRHECVLRAECFHVGGNDEVVRHPDDAAYKQRP